MIRGLIGYLLFGFISIGIVISQEKKVIEDPHTLPSPLFQTMIPAILSDQRLANMEFTKDSFRDIPGYRIGDPSQMWIRGNWKGRDDLEATLKVVWDKEYVLLIINVQDDNFIPSTSPSLTTQNGDYILLRVVSRKVAVKKQDTSLRILLRPDPIKGVCPVNIFCSDELKPKLGEYKTKLISTGHSSYQIFLLLSTTSWDSPPEGNASIGFQMIVGDSDELGKIEHVFALFAPLQEWQGFLQMIGSIYFIDYVWCRLSSPLVFHVPDDVKITFDWGNMSNDELYLTLELVDKEGKVIQQWEKVHRFIPGMSKQNVTIPLNMKGVPWKDREPLILRSKAGTYFDPAFLKLIRITGKEGADWIVLTEYIPEWDPVSKRTIPISQKAELVKETFRMMAGQGRVLWSVGHYNADFKEFDLRFSQQKPIIINLNQTTDNRPEQIPAYLPGQQGIAPNPGTSLVIQLDKNFVFNPKIPAIRPFPPFRELLEKPEEIQKTLDSAQRLLLVGILTARKSQERSPEIQIKDQHGRILVHTRLTPDYTEHSTQQHVVVLRVWLTGSEESISIQDINPLSQGIYFDFFALIGGTDELDRTSTGIDGSINFSGNPEATLWNQMVSAHLFFARHYLMDENSKFIYSSLPGGSKVGGTHLDYLLLGSELIAWLPFELTQKFLESYPSIHSFLKGKRDEPLYQALTVYLGYQLWQRSGFDDKVGKSLWFLYIEPNLTALQSSLDIHELGLLGGQSEWGVPIEYGGGSLAVSILGSIAFEIGGKFANLMREPEKAETWKKSQEKLRKNIQLLLVAPPSGLKVDSSQIFPAVGDIPEQKGIQSVISQYAWIYGISSTKEPILYHQNTRRFDAPNLLAFLPILLNYSGVELDKDLVHTIQHTIVFLRNSLPMKHSICQQFNLISYHDSLEHLYFTIATLAADQTKLASTYLSSLVRYSYREGLSIGKDVSLAISPLLIPGRFFVSETGKILGGRGEEGGAQRIANFLQLTRLMVGLDDQNPSVLKFFPRLPEFITGIEIQNWPITHQFDHGGTGRISGFYQKNPRGEKIEIRSHKTLQRLLVRCGPYPLHVKNLRIIEERESKVIPTVTLYGQNWGFIEKKRILNLRVDVSPLQP